MPSEARQKEIIEKLNRAQKCSILGPQNLGSGGPGPPRPPPDPHLPLVCIFTFKDSSQAVDDAAERCVQIICISCWWPIESQLSGCFCHFAPKLWESGMGLQSIYCSICECRSSN